MKSSLRDVAASALGVPLDLLTEQGAESATIEILHSVTTDSLDGQPWPPTERNVLWRLRRRADGCSHWRAIELAESYPLPRTSQFHDRQQLNLKG